MLRPQTSGAAGVDVRLSLPWDSRTDGLRVPPGRRVLAPTGLCMEIPPGHEVQVRPRSGLSYKTALIIPNSPGTIDSDYRGELKVILANVGDREEFIAHGDRIAQIVVAPVLTPNFSWSETLEESERGAGGFGSTGRN